MNTVAVAWRGIEDSLVVHKRIYDPVYLVAATFPKL